MRSNATIKTFLTLPVRSSAASHVSCDDVVLGLDDGAAAAAATAPSASETAPGGVTDSWGDPGGEADRRDLVVN